MISTDFILPLLAAALAGGGVGFERQINNKNAGLRTNMLVAVGTCIFVLINISVTASGGDPSRIIGQIVTGIGFLGAGVILHRGANVQVLTTAATIWCSAALGCLAELSMYWEAAFCTVLILLINVSFKKADKWVLPKKNGRNESHDDIEYE